MIMDYKKTVILPPSPSRKIPSPVGLLGLCQGLGNACRYQYDLKPDEFDPFGSSPPQKFMLKLKERLVVYSSDHLNNGIQINDFMRKSE